MLQLVLKHAKPRFDHETSTDILLVLLQTCEHATAHFEHETVKHVTTVFVDT